MSFYISKAAEPVFGLSILLPSQQCFDTNKFIYIVTYKSVFDQDLTMYSQDACVRDILDDYLKEERNLENKIRECSEKRFKINPDHIEDAADVDAKNPLTMFGRIDSAESELRNQRFLKELEEAKARLRTIASFTPTDQELRVLAGAYRGLLGNVVQSRQHSTV